MIISEKQTKPTINSEKQNQNKPRYQNLRVYLIANEVVCNAAPF